VINIVVDTFLIPINYFCCKQKVTVLVVGKKLVISVKITIFLTTNMFRRPFFCRIFFLPIRYLISHAHAEIRHV